ncbi:hypothetical protein KAT36_02805 [Candidatus Pacearchaeota archaeon]|nr:hypothetical protein [Candidatus Pacearchaeota archaeon]
MVEKLRKILEDSGVSSLYFSGEEKGNKFVVYVGNDYAASLLKKRNISGVTVVTNPEKFKNNYFGPKEVLEEKTLEGIFSKKDLYSSDIGKSKICYPNMTDDRFVVHSGNREAVDVVNYSFERFLKGESCDPICILGLTGSGKSSLLSNILIRGLKRGKSSSYLNINGLKSELRAKRGPKGIDLSYFFGADIVGIDSSEMMPLSKFSKWTRGVMYDSLDRGFGNGSLHLLSFMGDREVHSKFLMSVPHEGLKDRLRGIEVVELRYPERGEYGMMIESFLAGSPSAPKDKSKFEEVVSYFNSVIPEGLTVRGIAKDYIQRALALAERNNREIEINDIQASLSFQQNLFNPNPNGPHAMFDKILRERGYDAELIRSRGRPAELVEMRDNVIGDLWRSGVTNLSQIGKLVDRKHGSIINSLRKLGLRK